MAPLLERTGDWQAFLAAGLDAAEHEAIRARERTGRALGSGSFVAQLQKQLSRVLKK